MITLTNTKVYGILTAMYYNEEVVNGMAQKQVKDGAINENWSWEYPHFIKMLPNFRGKRVLDLGCGFGWHCKLANEQGAKSVIGVDSSAPMLEKAKQINQNPVTTYVHSGIEDFDYDGHSDKDKFDVVLSSMALHYVRDFQALAKSVYNSLANGGQFIFSIEHPIFLAPATRDWVRIGNYFNEGAREMDFLGTRMTKYHRTIGTYVGALKNNKFQINDIQEPCPSLESVNNGATKLDRINRPSVLFMSASKE